MTIDDLKNDNLILFEVIAGSRSFGLDTPRSDTDIKGVFYLPKDRFFGLEYIPQVSNETNDIVYYEIGRFVDLLLKNNPNILEMLASPADCVLIKNPLINNLKLSDFLSKLCRDTFAGYAMTQIRKAQGLNKKIVNPLPKEKKSLLDFSYIIDGYKTVPVTSWLIQLNYLQENCGLINIPNSKGIYALFYDAIGNEGYRGIISKTDSNEVSISSVPMEKHPIAYLSVNADAYSRYCKEYRGYWDWVQKRNDERYTTNLKHGKNYDSKNMMHTIRLLQSAENILHTGNLEVKVRNRQELLDIKSGNRDYDDLMKMADGLLNKIESLYNDAPLPEFPDKQKAERILIEIRSKLYES